MALGENIYSLRKKKKYSQEDLAEKINVTRQTISNWELGETSPKEKQLKLLSKALDVSIDELVSNEVKTINKSENNLNLKRVVLYIDIFCVFIWFVAAITNFIEKKYEIAMINLCLSIIWMFISIIWYYNKIKK